MRQSVINRARTCFLREELTPLHEESKALEVRSASVILSKAARDTLHFSARLEVEGVFHTLYCGDLVQLGQPVAASPEYVFVCQVRCDSDTFYLCTIAPPPPPGKASRTKAARTAKPSTVVKKVLMVETREMYIIPYDGACTSAVGVQYLMQLAGQALRYYDGTMKVLAYERSYQQNTVMYLPTEPAEVLELRESGARKLAKVQMDATAAWTAATLEVKTEVKTEVQIWQRTMEDKLKRVPAKVTAAATVEADWTDLTEELGKLAMPKSWLEKAESNVERVRYV